MARFIALLLCLWLFPGVEADSTLRDRVINSFLEELESKALDEPEFQTILAVIKDKVDETGDTCVLMEHTRCMLHVTTNSDRVIRGGLTPVRPFLVKLIGNITKKSFPRLTSVLTNIFSNDTNIGSDLHNQFDTSAQILLIKTLDRLTNFTDRLGHLKAPVLTLLSLILVFATVLLMGGIIRGCESCREKQRERKAKKYDEYFRRRTLALEA